MKYTKTCRLFEKWGALRTAVWPKDYLLYNSCTNLYSLDDLSKVAEGNMLDKMLKNALDIAEDHVFNCSLCCAQGFICSVCNSDQVIFPFQLEYVVKCSHCRSLMHASCSVADKECTVCQRK